MSSASPTGAVWRGQTWYPVLLGMFWNFPRLIALAPNLISKTKRCPNGDGPSTRHVTCLWEKFFSSSLLRRLLSSCYGLDDPSQPNHTTHKWATELSCNPVSGPASDVSSFLAELHEEGYQASSLNAFRSAISWAHDQIDGVTLGKHPLLCGALKVAFHATCRPPLPHYTAAWNVQYKQSLNT